MIGGVESSWFVEVMKANIAELVDVSISDEDHQELFDCLERAGGAEGLVAVRMAEKEFLYLTRRIAKKYGIQSRHPIGYHSTERAFIVCREPAF